MLPNAGFSALPIVFLVKLGVSPQRRL